MSRFPHRSVKLWPRFMEAHFCTFWSIPAWLYYFFKCLVCISLTSLCTFLQRSSLLVVWTSSRTLQPSKALFFKSTRRQVIGRPVEVLYRPHCVFGDHLQGVYQLDVPRKSPSLDSWRFNQGSEPPQLNPFDVKKLWGKSKPQRRLKLTFNVFFWRQQLFQWK